MAGLGASLNGILTGGNSSLPGFNGTISSYKEAIDQIYQVQPDNWYKSKPYGFVFFDRQAQGSINGPAGRVTFWLPISPNNIQVTTHFATNLITTLYGVVEEHSEVRYYDIVISGTTGYAPTYFANVESEPGGIPGSFSSFKSTGRESHTAGFLESISLPGGIGAGALGAASQIAKSVTDAAGSAFGIGGGVKSGVDLNKTGYVAFHNFYRFLLQYKKDGAGLGPSGFAERKVHPLQFLNYKDRVQYDCVPQTFTLTRSAESPMLYNYMIKMRAFNLRSVVANPAGVGTEEEFLASLGLASSLTDQFNNALGAIGGAVGAVSSLIK